MLFVATFLLSCNVLHVKGQYHLKKSGNSSIRIHNSSTLGYDMGAIMSKYGDNFRDMSQSGHNANTGSTGGNIMRLLSALKNMDIFAGMDLQALIGRLCCFFSDFNFIQANHKMSRLLCSRISLVST